MSIWQKVTNLADLNSFSAGTAVEALGIEIIEMGEDYLKGRMPVDHRTIQPFGILHGGASVVLAESLGSLAAFHCLHDSNQMAVGLDINANHIRSVTSGWVIGTARPIHVGSSTHVWEIRIETEGNKLVCISRLTMAIINR